MEVTQTEDRHGHVFDDQTDLGIQESSFGRPESGHLRNVTLLPFLAEDAATDAPRVRIVQPKILRRALVAVDALTITAAIALTFVLFSIVRNQPLAQPEHLALAGIALPTWLFAMAVKKLYVARAIERPSEEFRRLVFAGVVGTATMVGVAFAFSYAELSRLWVAGIFVVVTIALAFERRAARVIFRRLRASGRINRRVAIIGSDAHAVALLQTVQRNPSLGYEVVGFIDDSSIGSRDTRNRLGDLCDTVTLLREHRCVGAMVSLSSVDADNVNRLTRILTDQGFHIALSTSLRDIDVTRMRPQNLDGQTLIYVEPTIRTGWRTSAKRVFDLVLSTVGLVVAAPIIGLAGVLIRLESRGPVFFRQERVGREGSAFQMVKLRTMFVDAEERKADLITQNEADGPLFKMEWDPRITRVGRILRKLSIDELPQFWNVLRGDMSVVGPRPALPAEVVQWDPELHDRLRVLPGITGMWQVSGRSDTSFDEYKRLDLYYVDNWSLLHDLRIVMRTFAVVLLQRGAS